MRSTHPFSVDRGLVNVVVSSKGIGTFRRLFNFSNFSIRNLFWMVRVVRPVLTSPLSHLISVVIPPSPQKQVIGPHTRRVVAGMTDIQGRIKRAVRDLVTNAMSQLLTVNFSFNPTIPLRPFISQPNPTAICLFNSRPKSGNQMCTQTHSYKIRYLAQGVNLCLS